MIISELNEDTLENLNKENEDGNVVKNQFKDTKIGPMTYFRDSDLARDPV